MSILILWAVPSSLCVLCFCISLCTVIAHLCYHNVSLKRRTFVTKRVNVTHTLIETTDLHLGALTWMCQPTPDFLSLGLNKWTALKEYFEAMKRISKKCYNQADLRPGFKISLDGLPTFMRVCVKTRKSIVFITRFLFNMSNNCLCISTQ